MYWFWLNILPAAAFFAIWTGVPLWLVLKHPDVGSGPDVPHARQEQAAESSAPQPSDVHTAQHASGSRAFAGAPR